MFGTFWRFGPFRGRVGAVRGLCLNLSTLLMVTLLISTQFRSDAQAFGRRALGTSGAQFLKLPVNARAIAMGEAYSAVTDGADAIYWNPARLGLVSNSAFSLMHAAYFQSTTYDFASYAQNAGLLGTFAVGAQYFNAGSLDETDDIGTPLGTLSPYDLAVSVGWGKAFNLRLASGEHQLLAGVTGKYIRSKISETASSGAVDLGASWKIQDRYSFSAALQNLGGEHRFRSESDTLPINLKLGYSVIYWQALTLAADINFPRDNDPSIGAGTEYKKALGSSSWFAGRAGYNSRSAADIEALSSVSLGCGLGWKAYGVDFAWVPFGDLGHAYRVSLSAKY